MAGGAVPGAGGGYRWLGGGQELLDRALVAGLLLDAALSPAPLPLTPQARGRILKTRVQETLLSHLAGRITLDRFHTLILALEQSFAFYFPLISSLLPPAAERPLSFKAAAPVVADATSASRAVLTEVLAQALERLQKILPHRPQRKLTGPKLQDFLSRTGGAWFRLKDFQEHFAMDRKTAWEYVQKFVDAGLLVHNQGRAAAVRYGLADDFLQVRAGSLRREVAQAISALPSPLAPLVADLLIAGGGEPFWEEEWRPFLPAAYSREIINRLTAAGAILEVVCCRDGQGRLLRLKKRLLQSTLTES